MLLGGDLGGTKTLLGLFHGGHPRPALAAVREFATNEHDGLPSMIQAFFAEQAISPREIEAAAIGVAGPIVDGSAQLTNVAWGVSARGVQAATGIERVRLLNDVEAMAWSLDTLGEAELAILQPGRPAPDGHAALLTVGTGLGQAFLHRVDGRLVPQPSEGGHADFAARTPEEIELLIALTARFGRVDAERVVSGPGLANIASFTHGGTCELLPQSCDHPMIPALISSQALEGRCAKCREALDLMVGAMGSVAGNVALHGVARSGVFIGGGVPPKIRAALETVAFLDGFRNKPPMDALLADVPVALILDERAGLLGAAVFAAGLAAR